MADSLPDSSTVYGCRLVQIRADTADICHVNQGGRTGALPCHGDDNQGNRPLGVVQPHKRFDTEFSKNDIQYTGLSGEEKVTPYPDGCQ